MLEYGVTDFKMYHFSVDVTLCLRFKFQTFFPMAVLFLFDFFLKHLLIL